MNGGVQEALEVCSPIGEVVNRTPRICVLDAGAQYVDLIKKNCERLGYMADILPLDSPFAAIEKDFDSFIISGGPADSYSNLAPMPDPDLWKTKKGVFGICYGQQIMAQAFGGRVVKGDVGLDGIIKTSVDNEHPLFTSTKEEIDALFTFGNHVESMPEGFKVIGSHITTSGKKVISGIARDNFAAVQFHPEVFDETPMGYAIFQGFLKGMCNLEPDSSLLDNLAEERIAACKQKIKEEVGDRHVIAFASGGTDSAVVTVIGSDVIARDKLHVFYFDNGYMRDEDDQVIDTLRSLGIDVNAIDATEEFEQATVAIDGVTYGPLIEVSDPKIKRKIVGEKFVDLKNKVAAGLGLDVDEVMLLQGTNAADRIESGFSLAKGQVTEQIKEHHNQVQGIKDLEAAGRLTEPLNQFHKDEIRIIGEHLGIPEEIVWRQPFPGPANVIRIICGNENSFEPVDKTLQAEVQYFVKDHSDTYNNLYTRLLPAKSVGVGGDARSYIVPAALQGDISWQELEFFAKAIPANFRGKVNRVVHALGRSVIDDLTITTTTLGRAERQQLRKADHIVFDAMREFKLLRKISQCPVILIPIGFDHERSIVVRPITTSTFLTAKAMLPTRDVDPEFLSRFSQRILEEVPGISQVFLDITNKPPGTIEWE